MILNRLQFRKHDEVFDTRQDAIDYIYSQIRFADDGLAIDNKALGYSLLAEPTVLLYKNITEDDETGELDPHLIFAIGSKTNVEGVETGHGQYSDNRFCIIDIDKTEQEIADLAEEVEKAIKSLTVIALNSDTLNLYADKTDDGTFMSGDVKVADTHVFDDDIKRNNNLMVTPEGLFIYVNLTWDEENDTFTFTISNGDGTITETTVKMPNNYLVSGIYDKTIESLVFTMKEGEEIVVDCEDLIGEWGVEGYDSLTPIILTRDEVDYDHTDEHNHVEPWQDVLRADVRIKDEEKDAITGKYVKDPDSTNILERTGDGRYLYVDGKASNILYWNRFMFSDLTEEEQNKTTVKNALDRLSNIRLSPDNDNIIVEKTDGFFASTKLEYVSKDNKLVFKASGQEDTVIQLNSVELFEHIYYDPTKEALIVTYKDNKGETQFVEIPIGEMIRDWEWEVQNEGHDVKLVKTRNISGNDKLSADVKIFEGHNNILTDTNHSLYVRGEADNIKYLPTGDTTVKDVLDELKAEDAAINTRIDEEIERAESAEQALDEKIEAETERAEAAEEVLTNKIGTGFTDDPHDNVTFKFEALSAKTDAEIERSISEDERINNKLDEEIERSTNKDNEHDEAIDRIDVTIGSGFTTDAHETVTYKFDQLQNQVNEEAAKLQSEIDRSKAKDEEHDGRLDAIDAEIGEGFGPRNTVRYEIDNLQSEIDAVSADTSMRLTDVINEDESIDVETRNDENGKPTIKVLKVNLSEEAEDDKPNIIKLNADGLYAGVDLIYEFNEEVGTNQLIFKTTNGTKTYDLKTNSVVDKIYYDPSREAIIIEYTVNGHRMPDVVIPVGDLINEWRVEDGHPHAVQLEKVRVASGTSEQDVLKASVIITDNHDDNILVMDDGALYVSGTQISANTAAIEQEIVDRIADVDEEEDRAKAAEEALNDRLVTAEGDIDALENSLREEVGARTLSDEALGRRIDQEIADRIADVNAEETRAKAAEQALSDKIDADVLAEKNRALSAETALQSAINDEIHNREDDVNAEETRAISAETALSNKIDSDVLAEKNRAISAETALQTAINDEIHNREDDVNTEETRAKAAEQTLSDKIDTDVLAEKNRALSAETALQTAINDEVTRATSAETGLRSDLTTAQSNIQSEISRATGEEQRIETKLNNEITRSTDKDQELLNAIAAELTRATSAETDIRTAINNEATYARTVENNLSHSIEDEAERRISGDTILQGAIDREISRAINAESGLNIAITSEIERATGKEAELAAKDEQIIAALQQEIEDREQGDAELAQAIRDAALTFDNTVTTKMNKTTGNVVTTDVIVPKNNNIIIVDEGVKAYVRLDYNAATNQLILEKTDGSSVSGKSYDTITLNAGSLIDAITYDSDTKELVIRWHSTDDPQTPRETRVSVEDLFNPWLPNNPSVNSAIELTLTDSTGPLGEDQLSAKVLITDDHDGDGKPDQGSDNAIEIRNNGLYVNGSAISGSVETAECTKNELRAVERAVIGHIIAEECGSGYTYEPNQFGAYINSATSFASADYILDLNLKRVEDKSDDIEEEIDCIDSKTDALYAMLYTNASPMPQCGSGATYQPYQGACIISGATSFMEADQLLNDQICELLTMWVSGITCTNESTWIEDGANRKLNVDTRLSHGKFATMTDEDLYTVDMSGDYIDPTNTEFTDTNALRIVCLDEGPSGVTPSVDTKQNGIYLSNVWDCGLYYDEGTPADQEAKLRAQAAGYNTNYSTDESSSARSYNYNNNVR